MSGLLGSIPAHPAPTERAAWSARALLPMTGRPAQVADLLLPGVVLLLVAGPEELASPLQWGILALCVLLWRVSLVLAGVYAPARLASGPEYLLRCVIGLNGCTLVATLRLLLLRPASGLWQRVGLFWLAVLLLGALFRLGLLLWARKLRRHVHAARQILIVGSGKRASQAAREVERRVGQSCRVVGYVDSEPQESFVPASQILGGIDDLQRLLQEREVDEVILALPMRSQYEAVGYSLGVCQMMGVPARYFTGTPWLAGARPGAPSSQTASLPARKRAGWWRRLRQDVVSTGAGEISSKHP